MRKQEVFTILTVKTGELEHSNGLPFLMYGVSEDNIVRDLKLLALKMLGNLRCSLTTGSENI